MSEKPPSGGGNGGGMARLGSGTRIVRFLSAESDLELYVKQAASAALAMDLVLCIVLLTVLVIGWPTLVVLGLAFGFLAGYAGLQAGHWFRLELPDWCWAVLGNLWAICGIAGIAAAIAWALKVTPILDLLRAEIAAVLDLDWWWFAIGAAVAVGLGVWAKRWWVPVGVSAAELVGAFALRADLDVLALAWSGLRYLLVVFAWPFAGWALVLAFVLFKELLWPNAEFTLAPVATADLGYGGLWSFYFPWLIEPPPSPPEPDHLLTRVSVTSANGRHVSDTFLPPDPKSVAFYRAVVYQGKSFASTTASDYGISTRKFDNLMRDELFQRDMAWWVDEDNHQQGIEVFDEGMAAMQAIVDAHSPTLDKGARSFPNAGQGERTNERTNGEDDE